jgi:hypothetical protein
MIEQLTPAYRFVCDRCGKEQFSKEGVLLIMYPITFSDDCGKVKSGDVCRDCYKDFCDLAENFFDEVNKNEM